MMYTEIRKLLNREHKERKDLKIRYIQTEENNLIYWLTPARLAQYKAGTLDRSTAEEIAIKRAVKSVDTDYERMAARLDEIENAPDLKGISITVEWKKSRTWGMNPTATIKVWNTAGRVSIYEGKASGCGYDKESAAVASALAHCPEVSKLLCNYKEKALRKLTAAERKTAQNRDLIAYGSGYCVIPALEGGVGFSCHETIFKKCGLKRMAYSCTRNSDFYAFEA